MLPCWSSQAAKSSSSHEDITTRGNQRLVGNQCFSHWRPLKDHHSFGMDRASHHPSGMTSVRSKLVVKHVDQRFSMFLQKIENAKFIQIAHLDRSLTFLRWNKHQRPGTQLASVVAAAPWRWYVGKILTRKIHGIDWDTGISCGYLMVCCAGNMSLVLVQ